MATEKEVEGEGLPETAKRYLRTKLFCSHFDKYDYEPTYLKDALRKVTDLLERSIQHGESNSLLLIGQRGIGKSWVVEKALSSLTDKHGDNNFIKVYLNGLVHTDDYHALMDIARQLNVTSPHDTPNLSHAGLLDYLLDNLQSGNKKDQCIVFILDEFDLFTHHKNQSLLYNLLNISQSPANPVALVGLTCRLDVTELLEKRVRSRFSHRQILMFATCDFEEYKRIFISLLQLPTDDKRYDKFSKHWNEHITNLAEKENDVITLLRKLYYHSANCQNLKNFLFYAVSTLQKGTPIDSSITIPLLKESYQATSIVHHSLLHEMSHLSILELYLLVTCKHIITNGQYDFINFELIFQEFQKYASEYLHNSQFFNKAIVFKALSKLVSLELLHPTTTTSSLLEEYESLHLMVTEHDIIKTVQSYSHCPTDLYYWATHTTAA